MTKNRRPISLDKVFSFGALALLFVIFSLTANNFFTIRNVLTMALQTSTITLMGIGVTFVIITGGIDLSVGSVIAFSGTIAVIAANLGVPIWVSIFLGLLSGIFWGLVNGVLVTRLLIPSFIATLGTMMVIRGIILTITNANTTPAPDEFGNLGNMSLFQLKGADGTTIFPGISYIVVIMVALAFVCHFVLKNTRLGRYTYSVGSNEEAARLSGIKVKTTKLISYAISGLLSAVVGVLLASRLVTSQPMGGVGYELNAIAAAVIGGTSLMGGIGTVGGTVLGSFIIGILNTGLTMQGANYFAQQIVIGCVVIAAVAVDQLRNRRKA